MIDIASLVALCKAALSAGSTALQAYARTRLSEQAEELLIAAAGNGEFVLLDGSDQRPGTTVRTDRRAFCDDGDPAVGAAYLEAFRMLCERGYVVHECGMLFMLSGTGFTRARALAAGVRRTRDV